MHECHRVVWSEGLLLSPHHFQQSDLYHEAQLAERMALAHPYGWGIRELDIDSDALRRGEFRVLACRGILPGGTVVRIPEFDPPPPIVSFQDTFDVRDETLDFFLGVPSRRTGWPNHVRRGDAGEGTGEARFTIAEVTVADETSGRNDRSIERAQQNFKVLLPQDQREHYEHIPLARVTQQATGDFRLVEEFVPPAIALQASPYLVRVTRGLLERLSALSTKFGSRFGDGGIDARDITPANLRFFLHFAAVNTAIPALAHLREHPSAHPEVAYRALSALAGQLTAFKASRFHPRDVPLYRHDALGKTFADLERILIELLDIRDEDQGYGVLQLDSDGHGRYAVVVDDRYLSGSAALILSVASEGLSEDQIQDVVRRGRLIVASADAIDAKIARNIPGLPLAHLSRPPSVIPPRGGTLYFELDRRDREWEAISATKKIAVQIPAELRDGSTIELLGVEARR